MKMTDDELRYAANALTDTRLGVLLRHVLNNEREGVMETMLSVNTQSDELVKYQHYGIAIQRVGDLLEQLAMVKEMASSDLLKFARELGVDLLFDDPETEVN